MKEKKKIFTIIGVSLLAVVLVYVSYRVTYAWFTNQGSSNTDLVTSGKLDIDYVGGSNILNGKLIPTDSYQNGLSSMIKFKTKSGSLSALASIYLDITTLPAELQSSALKWSLYKNNEENPINTGDFLEASQGSTLTLLSNFYANPSYDTYTLYIWLNGEEADNSMINKSMSVGYYAGVTHSNAQVTIHNLVTNGSFEDGDTGWTLPTNTFNISNVNPKFGKYSAVNINSDQYKGIRNSGNMIDVIPGHKYYYMNWLFTSQKGTGVCYIHMGFNYDNSTHTDDHDVNLRIQRNVSMWEKKSYIVTCPSDTNQPKALLITLNYDGTDNDIECYADGVVFVDLTEDFGVGQEPSVEWCNANIDYFDGSKTVFR